MIVLRWHCRVRLRRCHMLRVVAIGRVGMWRGGPVWLRVVRRLSTHAAVRAHESPEGKRWTTLNQSRPYLAGDRWVACGHGFPAWPHLGDPQPRRLRRRGRSVGQPVGASSSLTFRDHPDRPSTVGRRRLPQRTVARLRSFGRGDRSQLAFALETCHDDCHALHGNPINLEINDLEAKCRKFSRILARSHCRTQAKPVIRASYERAVLLLCVGPLGRT